MVARVFACLFIESRSTSTDAIAQMIGVPADRSWSIGDPRGKTGKSYATNSWSLISETEVSDESVARKVIKARIADILERIRGHEAMFRSTATGEVSGLLLGITANSVPAIILEASQVAGIATLGVDLEIDILLSGDGPS